MRLAGSQWLWTAAVGALFGAMILDVLDLISPPNLLWLVAAPLLLVAGWFIMPASDDFRQVKRGG